MTMVIFGTLFSLLLGRENMPTMPGVPYAVSTYCALIPWKLFSKAVAASGGSLVQERDILLKVYFPRLVIPVAPPSRGP